MATVTEIKVRHFIVKRGAGGEPLYYWQPTAALRKQGRKPQRLPDNERLARNAAETINQHLDDSRGRYAPPLRRQRPPSHPQGIYVIGPPDGAGPQKIGISENPINRWRTLQSANPLPLRLLFFLCMDGIDAAGLERRVHDILRHKRLRGEWFDLDLDRAMNTIITAAGHLRARRSGTDQERKV